MRIYFPNRSHKSIVTRLFNAGLAAAQPDIAIGRYCKRRGETLRVAKRTYQLRSYNRIVCVGMGKASVPMVHALEQLLGNRLTSGLLVVKDFPQSMPLNIEGFQAGHPTPDNRSLKAAKAVQRLLGTLTHHDLLIALISGGTSSLIAAPAPGLTLSDKQRTTELLLRSGASIQEMNVVRKHLSAVKGGQLAASTSSTVISLILSDVAGDDIATIGSGPTAPDPTTHQQARRVLEQYNIWHVVPARVQQHIKQGIRGTVPETPKPGDPRLQRVQNIVIGNNQSVIQQIKKTAKHLGFRPVIQETMFQGEAKELGQSMAVLAKKIVLRNTGTRRPMCFIWGGEPTVRIKKSGQGGRVQECVLAAAIGLAGLPNVIMAGLGTDGSDGPTDAAGAVVSGDTVRRARLKGIDPQRALNAHDSYRFFQDVGAHIKTGPTGTNVNDIYILLTF
ncbi:MAG: glycerate kinase [Nitrospirales bacterium]|nr:glycerate kinase [Nitrospira sp.]MDR4501410.1 glycerate kinase [Nitrospirales bacterium]